MRALTTEQKFKYALVYRGTPLLAYPKDWSPDKDSREDLPLVTFDTPQQAEEARLEHYGCCAYNAVVVLAGDVWKHEV